MEDKLQLAAAVELQIYQTRPAHPASSEDHDLLS